MTTYQAKANKLFATVAEELLDLRDSIEFRSAWPIVAVWFGLFFFAIQIQNNSYGLRESLLITVSSTGLAMAAAWTVFCHKSSTRRMVFYAGLVTVMTTFGVFSSRNSREFGDIMLITLLSAVVCLVPLWFAKRFFGWRIVHAVDKPNAVADGRQFSIYEILGWTTFAALLMVIANYVGATVFGGRMIRVLFFLSIAVFLPSVVSLVFFGFVGRLNTVQLLMVTPLYSTGVATVICLIMTIPGIGGGPGPWREFFRLILWFSIAGWGITAAVRHLRNRGFVFLFGRSQWVISAGHHFESQIESIEKRIAKLEIQKNNFEQELRQLYS